MELALSVSGKVTVRHAINYYHSVQCATRNLLTVGITIGNIATGKVVVVVVKLIQRETVLGVDTLPGVSIELVAVLALNNLLGTANDTVLVLLGQLQYLILNKGDVSTYVNLPILGLVHINVARNLHTTVRDYTHILGGNTLSAVGGGSTCRQWVIHVEQQVLITLVEVLDIEVQTIKHATLDSDTPRLSGFPLQVLVGQLCNPQGSLAIVASGVVKCHIAIVARSGIVTHLTIVGTQLQVVNPVVLLHPLLVADYPAGTSTPEVTPTGIACKLRRTIATERELDVIATVVAITHTSQVRLGVICIVIIIEIYHLGKVLQVVPVRHNLLVLLTIQMVVVVIVILVSQQGVDSVYTVLVVPVQLLLEGPVLDACIATCATSAITLTVTNHSTLVVVGLGVAHSQVTLQCKCKVVRQHNVGIGNTVQCVTYGLVLVQLILPNQVSVGELVAGNHHLSVGIGIRSAIVLLLSHTVEQVLACNRIVQMYGIDGRNYTTGVEWVAGGASRTKACVVVLVRTIHTQSGLQPVGGVDIDSHTGRQTIVARCLQIAVLVQIT